MKLISLKNLKLFKIKTNSSAAAMTLNVVKSHYFLLNKIIKKE